MDVHCHLQRNTLSIRGVYAYTTKHNNKKYRKMHSNEELSLPKSEVLTVMLMNEGKWNVTTC